MKKLDFMERFKDKRVDVIGFGVSNRPLVRMLSNAGALVTVRDRSDTVTSDPQALELIRCGVGFVTGEGYLEGIDSDCIFRSPGVKPWEKNIRRAVENGAVLTSEMELFFEVSPAPIIGITGSDGKTTSTTLTYLMLEEEQKRRGKGKVYVGGNIGKPLLEFVSEMTHDDFCVVELSSFQLYTMKKSPMRGAITNLSPNHLNWHTDMDDYVGAKCNICRHDGLQMLTVNADNALTYEIGKQTKAPVIFFSSSKQSYGEIVPADRVGDVAVYECGGIIYADRGDSRQAILNTEKIKIPGRHNVENYMTAIALTLGLVSPETVAKVAEEFYGVKHRLTLVREKDGVRFYNSSIDSSPTRTAAALSAMKGNIVIICGGQDKHVPFDGLASELCRRVKAVVLTGQAAPLILDAIEHCPEYDPERLTVYNEPDFEDAVMRASQLATAGDAVLLSPACTSFDRFKNFEERGDFFTSIVNRL